MNMNTVILTDAVDSLRACSNDIFCCAFKELCLQTKLLAPSSCPVADFLSKAPQPPSAHAIKNAVQMLKVASFNRCYIAHLIQISYTIHILQYYSNKSLSFCWLLPPFSSDNRCYGPVRRPDWSGLPPGRSACGTPPRQDGDVCCGAQVSGSHSNHCLYIGLSWPLHPSCPGLSKKSCSWLPQKFHFQLLQWPHGPAKSLPGRQGIM